MFRGFINSLLLSEEVRMIILTTQRSCRFPWVSAPWLLNFASKTTINATLSYTQRNYMRKGSCMMEIFWAVYKLKGYQATLTNRFKAFFFWALGSIASVKDWAALLNSTCKQLQEPSECEVKLKTEPCCKCKKLPNLVFFDMRKPISTEKCCTTINRVSISIINLQWS